MSPGTPSERGHRRDEDPAMLLLERQTDQLTVLTQQSQNLLKENERLRDLNRKLISERDAMMAKSQVFEATAGQKVDTDRLREENLILGEQANLLTVEVEQLQSTASSREEAINLLQQKFQALNQSNQAIKAEAQRLAVDKRSCEEKLVAAISKKQEHQDHCKRVQEELQELKNHRVSLQSRLQDLEHEKNTLDQEVTVLQTTLMDASSELCETRQKLADMAFKFDRVSTAYSQTSNDFACSKAEEKRLKAALELVQGSISESKRKQEESHKSKKESTRVQEEFVLERTSLLGQIEALKDAFSSRDDATKKQISNLWKEQEQQLVNMKQRHDAKCRIIQEELNKNVALNGELKGKIQRYSLEAEEMTKKHNLLNRLVKEERQHHLDVMAETVEQMAASKRLLEIERQKWEDANNTIQTLTQTLTKSREAKASADDMLKDLKDRSIRQIKSLQDEMAHFRSVLGSMSAAKQVLEEQSKAQNDEFRQKLSEVNDSHQHQMDQLKSKLCKNEERQVLLEHQKTQESRKHEAVVENLRSRTHKALESVDENFRQERNYSQKLQETNEQLMSQLHALKSEHEQLSPALQQATEKAAFLEIQYNGALQRLSQMGKTLATNLQAYQKVLSEQSHLKLQLREREMELDGLGVR